MYEGNTEHFFVATQDRSLQRKIADQSGGAVLFATVNGIQMDMPSEKQKALTSKSAQEKLLPGMLEIQSNMVSGTHESRMPASFRRRKAKGPNPLSIKKGKRIDGGSTIASGKEEPDERKKARRVRKSRAAGPQEHHV